MLQNYRVFIAGSQPQILSALKEMVQRIGCQIVGCTADLKMGFSEVFQADLIIIEGTPDFREAVSEIRERHLVPVLFYRTDLPVISSAHSGEGRGLLFTGRMEDDRKWHSAILIAVEKFQKRQDFFGSRDQMNSMGTTRSLVTQAQEYLAREMGISEIRAIYIMQVLSQNKGISLRQMAERIVATYRVTEETA